MRTFGTIESSPQPYARIDGVLYLLLIAMGFFAEGFVSDRLIVSGDAAATAHNILGAPLLWNLGVAADLLVIVFGIPQTLIEYLLLRPAGRHLALLAVLFILMTLAIETVSKLFLFAVLAPLGSATYLAAFDSRQLEALAYLALRSHAVGWNIALVFFGFACLINGHLVFRSRYLPKTVGMLLQLSGACYLVASSAALFAPAIFDRISPAILVPPFVGEATFCLWLLFKGVRVDVWKRRAAGLTGVEAIVPHQSQTANVRT
jgi:hypothetical protein